MARPWTRHRDPGDPREDQGHRPATAKPLGLWTLGMLPEPWPQLQDLWLALGAWMGPIVLEGMTMTLEGDHTMVLR